MRNSSTPRATDGIGRDKGIESLWPFLQIKDNFAEFPSYVF
ncbi:MAG TPA: hypothetical protein VFY61_13560 [Pyrinomonadaceae bacterium]|nr:hypothetical protein [Pyrinomonadaceae bacterium]